MLIGPDEDIQCFRHDKKGVARAVALQAVERRSLEQPANERLFLSGKNLLLAGAAWVHSLGRLPRKIQARNAEQETECDIYQLEP